MLTLGHRYEPADLLPQRESMLLLDSIVGYGENWLEAAVHVRAEDLFFEAGLGVPAWVGLEYMAQAAAAFGGIERVQRGERPTIGLLIGCREYRCAAAYFAEGTRLDVHAELVMRDENDFVAYDCDLRRGADRLAHSVLKAYRPQDIQALLKGQLGG